MPLCLAANDYKELSGVVDEADQASIFLSLRSTLKWRRKNVQSFIGANNYEAGQLAGRQLIKLIGTERANCDCQL